ncbi:MAG: Ig-like domain-containing protein [Verrucomicrobiales bacterium]|nr:Ig-like domain-containing protein [Verrucomicrobiales bacterium]
MRMKIASILRGLGIVELCLSLNKVAVSAAPTPQLQGSESTSGFRLLSAPNTPPEVRIVFPPQSVQFHLVAAVHIRAAASDADGEIKEVRFYDGTNLIGIATNAPYESVSIVSQRLSGSSSGFSSSSSFTAVAVDNEGASSTSSPIGVGFALHINGNEFQLLDSTGENFSRKVRVAPATFEVRAELETSDGVGNPVDFYLGTNKVTTVVDPPYVITISNVPAGEYNVRVGTTNALGVYSLYPEDAASRYVLKVIEPLFHEPARPSSSSFTFDFNGTLPYATNIIEQSTDLRTWLPIATNVTTTNAFSFRDTNALESLRFYRMKLFTAEPLLP